MVRPLNDSPFLYGIHDPGGERTMAEAGAPGWILFTEAIGSEANDLQGADYSAWAKAGYGIMARLNNGYEPAGTIPHSSRYGQFARRCANFVRTSRGCHIWIIGNEPNFAVERPGVAFDRSQNPPRLVSPGEVILPAMYAQCYRQCRAAIRAVSGHERDQVVVAAVAPWNVQTSYPSNPHGDWIVYFADVLKAIGSANCDGFTLHTYTHGPDPRLIYTDTRMSPPFQARQFNFRTYQDFLRAVPADMRALPAYITETDQDSAWVNQNNSWVQRAYGEIDWWNRQPGTQVIRALILYRWRNHDRWGIEGKGGVIDDFRQALAQKYNWEAVLRFKKPAEVVKPPPSPTPKPPAPETAPIAFKETGFTASGAFAAYYRKMGVEITGYPIGDEFIDPQSKLKTQAWERVVMEEVAAGKVRLRPAGRELAAQRLKLDALASEKRALEARVSGLERLIVEMKERGPLPSEPQLTDITNRLPRDPAGFVVRPLREIRYVVIHHTAVAPSVDAARVAQAHRQRYPGIMAHYFITGDGEIQQTNPIGQAVAASPAWLANGLNIFVAGNFDAVEPLPRQMQALARLCAWLLAEHNLLESSIRGASEFVSTSSPGKQWAEGLFWKQKLLAGLRDIWVAARLPSSERELRLARVAASMQSRIAAVATQVERMASATTEGASRIATPTHLPEPPAVVASPAVARSGELLAPDLVDVSAGLPAHRETTYQRRGPGAITHIALHHSAAPATLPAGAVAAHQVELGWPGIGYHFYIRPDGSIEQTNALETVAFHTAGHNGTAIGVCLAGNFIDGLTPTPQQLARAGSLIAWLTSTLPIPPANILGHKEFPGAVTSCPGSDWLTGKRWKTRLDAAIEAARAGQADAHVKTTPHYLLFWKRGNDWAREDWAAAADYMARFRPAAGFSLDDARQARYVTIVGGTGGVPYEAEQLLIASGAKVERLAGLEPTAHRETLDQMARTGRRFRRLVDGIDDASPTNHA